ncbi:hypothetical protein [Paenibacillus xylanexedens]|uniref:hypothetical protein n=1 Tax=Paenibacillus xylanexedens TaxID=528191 RepID=UPI003D025815
MKRVLSVLLTVALFFTLQSVAGAEVKQVTLSDIDQILRDSGTPENIISGLDDELKQMIYENSGSSPELKFIEVQQEVVPQLFASGYSIPSSDLKIEVLAFSVGSGKADIYPIYEWLKPVKPKGKDYFGYSTHSDFSVVANTRSNLIWYKLNSGDNWTSAGAATYTGSSLTGYEHSGSSLGTPDFPIYIKGNFSFRVDIDKTNPVKKIAISYVHDTSSGGTFGYSIGYGPAYISVTPSSSNVGYNTNVYNLVF